MKIKKVNFGAKMEALTKNELVELDQIKGGAQYPTCATYYFWDPELQACVRDPRFINRDLAVRMMD
ncbi:hypothetical protein BZARG_3085 [Bizionia argentinensis JUB59]|uniref:Bacteriocin n=1 Tax=Bizionia argentinensis JUB59 TaxID=1046627 RepID=G2EFF8_9FLAO|nr:hypothetical protein [Bizionia argentinensis]EGV42824.1 hypothetical protein BZARG_3085 [Bizionia argentinensis JUB59]